MSQTAPVLRRRVRTSRRAICAPLEPASVAVWQSGGVGYELRAVVGSPPAVSVFAAGAAAVAMELAEELELVPITDELFDRLGGGEQKSFGDAFYFLSGAIEALAVRASETAPIAYLEAHFFGGTGSQSAAVWSNRTPVLGPLTEEAQWKQDRTEWPINRVLRSLGVVAGSWADEFEAVRLGRHRSTLDWLPDDL